MRDHIRVDISSAAFWDAQNCGHQKIDVGIMTLPKLLKFMGAQKMYPRRKTVESCFILFQMVVKLFLTLKIMSESENFAQIIFDRIIVNSNNISVYPAFSGFKSKCSHGKRLLKLLTQILFETNKVR